MDENDLLRSYLDILLGQEERSSLQDEEGQYQEIRKLDAMLTEAEIPHELRPHMAGGYQLVYYGRQGKPVAPPGHFYGLGYGSVCSVLQTPFSYGHEEGLMEICGLITQEECERLGDTVLGGCSAEDVFARIAEHWKSGR